MSASPTPAGVGFARRDERRFAAERTPAPATAVADPEQRARHLALAADGPDPASPKTWTRRPETLRDGALRPPPQSSAIRCGAHAARRVDERRSPHHRRGAPQARRRARGTRALLEPLVDMLPASPRRARALFCLGRRRSAVAVSSCALNEAEGAGLDGGHPASAGLRRARRRPAQPRPRAGGRRRGTRRTPGIS